MSVPDDHVIAETLSQTLGFTEAVVEVGMTHPAVRRVLTGSGGTIAFLVALDDERIVDLEVEIGLGHRGFEKEVESLPWHRALPYVSRLGFAGGLLAEVGYCLTVERLAGVDVPERGTWLRMLGCEAARVADHFTRLSATACAIGLPAAEAIAQRGEVQAARLLAAITGRGPIDGWVRLGGVATPLADGVEGESKDLCDALRTILARFEKVAVDNPSCQWRLRNVAPLSVEECLAWGVTGPTLRAAGSPMDVRRDSSYLAYEAVDFDVPTGENGDAFDRLLVVVEEIRQSLRIVAQCQERIAGLGPGSIRVTDPGWLPTEEGDEASDGFATWLEGPPIPAGETGLSVEGSTGELGFFVVSDGAGMPRRIHCRAPSFLHAQALPTMLRGAHLDDLLPTAALLHLVSGECDR
jgi:NADH:ubiquinone oxidoreductase subunit D